MSQPNFAREGRQPGTITEPKEEHKALTFIPYAKRENWCVFKLSQKLVDGTGHSVLENSNHLPTKTHQYGGMRQGSEIEMTQLLSYRF